MTRRIRPLAKSAYLALGLLTGCVYPRYDETDSIAHAGKINKPDDADAGGAVTTNRGGNSSVQSGGTANAGTPGIGASSALGGQDPIGTSGTGGLGGTVNSQGGVAGAVVVPTSGGLMGTSIGGTSTGALGGTSGLGGSTSGIGGVSRGGSGGLGSGAIAGGGASATGGSTTPKGGTTATGGSTLATGGAPPATGGAPPICPAATHQCVTPLPTGWIGPIIYDSTTTLPSCPQEYSTGQIVGGRSVAPTTGTCTCECGVPTSSGCSASVVSAGSSSNTCQYTVSTEAMTNNSCSDVSGTASYKIVLNPPVATCGTGTYSTLAAATLTDQVRICGGGVALANACSATAEACFPKPPSSSNAKTCVYKDGSATCPSGYTATSYVVYRGVSDGRTCPTSCVCSPSGGVCRVSYFENDSSMCVGSNSAMVYSYSDPADACVSRTSGGMGASVYSIKTVSVSTSTQATCSGGSSTASGTATGSLPITVCCR